MKARMMGITIDGFKWDEGVGPDDVLRMEFNTLDEVRDLLRGKGERQGYREKKWLEMANRKREHKIMTRCGCLAKMRIKRKNGSCKWYMSQFMDEHNHELTSRKYIDYLRLHRRISDVEIAQMTSMREVGISIPKIYESFAAQVRSFNLVTFTKQDMRNQFDYVVFGDVLAFDATYGRNKYNLHVVVFLGVNHHNQTWSLDMQWFHANYKSPTFGFYNSFWNASGADCALLGH
ncbi:hypothetical protein AHAS_Ahas20G0114600 [Arachis hypogaea]